ncbi:alginate lyase family protein [Pedobacter nutrimenti]|uniref:Alginate lyase n=1 Tax=Pedobacter nutrimenti TaxID=1241337 RepID=A0A318UNX3_9SPHI|nr:alginate lyase family protein [Pedobacter nutrimenti]PYF72398.1 alginate lyase [Pedobacter nutrimenti]
MKVFGLSIALVLFFTSSYAQLPEVSLLNAGLLKTKKEAYLRKDKEVTRQVDFVLKTADGYLDTKPKSVLDKSFTPPSGSKHDYMSLAPYFWPDPAKADGRPYIRKDGERNPEIRTITDGTYLSDLNNKCKFLSLAYYFTNTEKYAAKASQLMQIWFLNPETKMNPNLNYAQAIRGVNDGRGIGIIETRSLADLADWAGLLTGSASWNTKEMQGLKDWYKQYLNWMMTSKNGQDEHHAKNNHGTHYDTQIVAFALFTGDRKLAAQTLKESLKRIPVQIEPDGQQPLELERTNAYGYSTMNLNGWFNLAILGEKLDIDLWNYSTTDGRSLRKALDWLIPYTIGDKPKDHKQISPYNKGEMYRPLLLAGLKYKSSTYLEAAAALPRTNENLMTDLLYR